MVNGTTATMEPSLELDGVVPALVRRMIRKYAPAGRIADDAGVVSVNVCLAVFAGPMFRGLTTGNVLTCWAISCVVLTNTSYVATLLLAGTFPLLVNGKVIGTFLLYFSALVACGVVVPAMSTFACSTW